MTDILAEARQREREQVMRHVVSVAVRLFDERGFDKVTMVEVAEEAGISVATLYRRFTTKENLVCWQPDEQRGMAALVASIRSGQSVAQAATALARNLPGQAVDAIEATARTRLRLMATHPSLQAAAREKAASFVSEVLAATDDRDRRPLLERETEARCVAAAFEAATNAWLRGEGSLRECTLDALRQLTRPLV